MEANPNSRPVVIGLLGRIAGGKSSAARALAAAGAAVLDADQLARAALDRRDLRRALLERHGPTIAAGPPPPGEELPRLDRAALARLVFADPAHRRHLEGLIHPLVLAEIDAALARHRAACAVPAVVLDVPLLLECDALAEACDLLLYIDTPEPLRIERARIRHGWSAAELAQRDATQLAPERKRAAADRCFANAGSEAQLAEAIDAWLREAGGFAKLPRRVNPRKP